MILTSLWLTRAVLKGQVFDADGKLILMENAERTVTGLITGKKELLADPAAGDSLNTKTVVPIRLLGNDTATPLGVNDNQPFSGRWADNPRSVSAALAWAQQQVDQGTSGWYNRCLAFCARAYGLAGSGTPYAIDIWTGMPADMRHTDKNYPVGALLLYRTGKRAGHIAIYAGGGKAYSNDVKRRGKIDLVTVAELNEDPGGWNLDYVGWTPPYFFANPQSKVSKDRK
jgi:hypothetical protein